MTNFHVVTAYLPGASEARREGGGGGGLKELRVNVPNVQTGDPVWYAAEVVGTQRSSDVAVLRLSPVASPSAAGSTAGSGSEPGSGSGPGSTASTAAMKLPLVAMPIGTSDALQVGQSCYALGAGDTSDADGSGRVSSFRQQMTLSTGVVSGLRRSIPSKTGTTIRNCIQTDAKIPESAAGGALLDSSGRLIGLTVTPLGNVSAGLSFAIPIDDLVRIVPSLITLHQIS